MFYYEINEDYKAIEDFTKVIEICSNDNKDYNDYYGYQERGWVYDKLKQYDKAVADYSKSIELEKMLLLHITIEE